MLNKITIIGGLAVLASLFIGHFVHETVGQVLATIGVFLIGYGCRVNFLDEKDVERVAKARYTQVLLGLKELSPERQDRLWERLDTLEQRKLINQERKFLLMAYKNDNK